jgi:hypothetical protein
MPFQAAPPGNHGIGHANVQVFFHRRGSESLALLTEALNSARRDLDPLCVHEYAADGPGDRDVLGTFPVGR